ncbi:hypothetical protein ACFQ7B_05960 [Streptomyces erythrochromogenes]|uniref:hypothetical protein n=1 Tax=Streptomyces erythrochromogenes TaxID=285574 RepID=UPI0036D1185F
MPISPSASSASSACSASDLTDLWLRGVAANQGAPAEVLLRLLHPAAGAARQILCEERGLPDEVADALLAHPDPGVRRSVARNPHLTPAHRGRLAEDPNVVVRSGVVFGPRPRPRRPCPLPDDVLLTLLTTEYPGEPQLLMFGEMVQELISSHQMPPSFQYRMRVHENPVLRELATGVWHRLTAEERQALLTDPDPDVRASAESCVGEADPTGRGAVFPGPGHYRWLVLSSYALSDAVLEAALADPEFRCSVAGNPYAPPHAVARLARDADPEVRERVAARADLDPAVWAELAEDPHERVRTRARIQPLPRTTSQCRAVNHEMGGDAHDCGCLILESYPEPDLDWYRACAESEEVMLRLAAARCPALPADLVARLAEDPHEEVRHRLASWHPLAPAETVLAAFVARPRQRPHLLMQSRLPRTGLSHLLDHEDPEVRALAAADPTLGRAPAALLTDPDDRVRRAAAANPLFTGDAVEALLHDPATAEGAAANQALPPARLHALLDLADLPR